MAGLQACPVAAWVEWVVWIIKPTLNRNDEGPELLPGLFLCCSHGIRLPSPLCERDVLSFLCHVACYMAKREMRQIFERNFRLIKQLVSWGVD
jgi:hypothetical protein